MLIIRTAEGLKQVVSPDIDIHEYAAVTGGTVIDDSEFVEPPKTVEQIKGDIAARRYEAETAGITVDGTFIDTGRDSQALITGAAVSAMMDEAYVCNWKTPDGFVQLDASNLKAICKAVRDHVQACFDREAALLVALEKGDFADDMLDSGWPA